MKVEKIYLDMDGVLADFDDGVRRFCDMEPIPQGDKQHAAYDDKLWERVKNVGHFYDKLALCPGAKEMFDRIYDKYQDKCEILTGIPKPRRGIETAGEDKTAWVRRLLSKDVVVNIVYREQKPQYCSSEGCILIDDYGKNIKEWSSYGGTGIHHKSAEETIAALEEMGVL